MDRFAYPQSQTEFRCGVIKSLKRQIIPEILNPIMKRITYPLGYNNAAAQSLETVRDVLRYGLSLFNSADLHFGHGTHNAYDEAAFIILEMLHLPIESVDPYLECRLTKLEKKRILQVFHARVRTHKPACYLLNKAYIQGVPFYVDDRVLVPRSFIAEILNQSSARLGLEEKGKVLSILDLCTGSGCLAILAAYMFPQAHVDAVDLSKDALAVAKRNIADHGMTDTITLHQGDLFAPVAGHQYDLIITNPPYVDAEVMATLPDEYRHEPSLALAGGVDGMDLVRKIVDQAGAHLNPGGKIICEIGTGRDVMLAAYPTLPFLWLDTEYSKGEVFSLNAADIPKPA